MQTVTSPLSTIHSLKAMSELYPDTCPEQSLRWQISQRHLNGLEESGALFKQNGRWFFDEVLYAFWLRGTSTDIQSPTNPLNTAPREV